MSFFSDRKRLIVQFVCFISGLGLGYITIEEAFTHEPAADSRQVLSRAPAWVRQGSEGAALKGANLSSSPRLRSIIGRVLKRDDSLNFEEALEDILETEVNSQQKLDVLILFFSCWADVDLDAALKRAEQLEPSLTLHYIKHEIFMKMISGDSREAARYYERNREALYAHKYYFLPELVRQWTMQSPEEAWNWVSSLKGEEQGDAMTPFFSGLGDSSVDKEKYLNQIMADPKIGKYVSIGSIIKDWAKHDLKNAVHWIESLDENRRERAWEGAIIGGAEDDLDLAASYLSRIPGNHLPDVLASVAEVIQHKEGSEAALNWMTGHLPKETRFPDFRVLTEWSEADSESAKSWLLQFTPEEQRIRDFALEAYVRASNDRNYEETLKMAQDINSPTLKKSAREHALRNWNRKDPDAARKWVERFEGAEDIKKELRKIVD